MYIFFFFIRQEIDRHIITLFRYLQAVTHPPQNSVKAQELGER
ncbi:hypothetical protein bpmyx0001_12630 [Bacillus pseudomycoides DSM 12442]|nr:hypothetical protein bpmyx0001_12630 [Bacillus pseudomycoides DSM 12442]